MFQTSCGEKPLLRNPVKHGDTARTLWALEFEKIGVKSCLFVFFLCAILLDDLGRPKIMIAVAVCEKVTYKRGRQSREEKLELF